MQDPGDENRAKILPYIYEWARAGADVIISPVNPDLSSRAE